MQKLLLYLFSLFETRTAGPIQPPVVVKPITSDELVEYMNKQYVFSLNVASQQSIPTEDAEFLVAVFSGKKTNLSGQQLVEYVNSLIFKVYGPSFKLWTAAIYERRLDIASLSLDDYALVLEAQYSLHMKWAESAGVMFSQLLDQLRSLAVRRMAGQNNLPVLLVNKPLEE